MYSFTSNVIILYLSQISFITRLRSVSALLLKHASVAHCMNRKSGKYPGQFQTVFIMILIFTIIREQKSIKSNLVIL